MLAYTGGLFGLDFTRQLGHRELAWPPSFLRGGQGQPGQAAGYLGVGLIGRPTHGQRGPTRGINGELCRLRRRSRKGGDRMRFEIGRPIRPKSEARAGHWRSVSRRPACASNSVSQRTLCTHHQLGGAEYIESNRTNGPLDQSNALAQDSRMERKANPS
jgi:hypothetical protein